MGGAREQRYQSIPVCLAARLPTRAQDVLVRTAGRGWGRRSQEWPRGGRGSRPGGWAGAGISPQPVPGAPWHFMEGEAAGQVGGWGTGGSLLQGSPQR